MYWSITIWAINELNALRKDLMHESPLKLLDKRYKIAMLWISHVAYNFACFVSETD